MAELLGVLLPELAERQPCLEIGVGTGRIALPLHDRGIAMAGMDIAEAMLRRLIGNAGGAAGFPLLLADATRLPLPDGSFGSVLAVHVLHLIPTWRDAVEEAFRVLRPGGVLIASFPGGSAHPRRTGPGASTPWAAVLREASQRHGVVRTDRGAHAPEEVADYLRHRATARRLPTVRVNEPAPSTRPCATSKGSCTRGRGRTRGSRSSPPVPRSARGRRGRASASMRSTRSSPPWSGGRSSWPIDGLGLARRGRGSP